MPRTSTPVAPVRGQIPSLRTEKRLFREGHRLLAACDEVGRGALSGPATVGVVLVDESVSRPLRGLRDSKLLLPPARVALVPRIQRWVIGHAVGHASAAEVDEIGILPALRVAAGRALAALDARPDVVLLDGNYDYLTPPAQRGLFGTESLFPELDLPRVVTQVKADVTCSSVAAASVLAKCARDAIMVELAATYCGYGWEINKGYATPEHLEALRRYGSSDQHRRSWRLPLQILENGPDEALIDMAAHVDPEVLAQALAAVGENELEAVVEEPA
jgi:ribonuclease HII